jgi:hypothetical protein
LNLECNGLHSMCQISLQSQYLRNFSFSSLILTCVDADVI